MKTITTFVLLFFAVNSFAQMERKNWHLGGGLNGSFDTGDYNFVLSGIHLQQGYMIKKNWLLGLHLSTDYYSYTNIPASGLNDPNTPYYYKKTYLNGVAAPFVRYFFGKAKWQPYAEAQTGIIYKSFREVYNDVNAQKTISSGFYGTASVAAGVAYFPYKNWGVDFGITYKPFDNFLNGTQWSSPVALRIGLRNVISKR